MARVSKTLLENISGGLGRQLVFKQYKGKTVVTAYPDMSNVKPSQKQQSNRGVFREAVAYAKAIQADEEKAEAYRKKLKEGETVYHYAIKEYFALRKKP